MMSEYELLELIGEGGMGTVYAAIERLSNGQTFPVACKLLNRDHRDDDRYITLFDQEAKAGRRVSRDHGGIVTMHAYIQDQDGRHFMVMDLIEGGSLEDLCKPDTSISSDALRLVAHDVLEAFEHIHGCDVVHRDISPGNILVSTQGKVKIADLGLAKEPTYLADAGKARSIFRGKPLYVAPEVIASKGADARSDLFSFGAVLYEIVAGKTLRPDGKEAVFKLMGNPGQALDVSRLPDATPHDVQDLIFALTQHRPEDRPQTAALARAKLHEPSDRAAARTELAQFFETIHQRGQNEPRRRRMGSLAGLLIRAIYISDGASRGSGKPRHEKRRTRPGVISRLRRAALPVVALGTVGALGLGIYALQTEPEVTTTIITPVTEPIPAESPVEMVPGSDEGLSSPLPSEQTLPSTTTEQPSTRSKPRLDSEHDQVTREARTEQLAPTPAQSSPKSKFTRFNVSRWSRR